MATRSTRPATTLREVRDDAEVRGDVIKGRFLLAGSGGGDAIFRYNHPIAVEEGIVHRRADADVGDDTHHDHGVDFEVLQCEVEIGVEECGIPALGNEDVVGARLEIIDHPRAP